MSFQPILSDSVVITGEVKFHLSHKDFYIDPATMYVDDSHVHNCYEIYVNVSGNVSFLHGDNIYMIKSGDVIFSEPGEVHHCVFGGACVHDHYCLWFDAAESEAIVGFLRKNNVGGHIRLDEENKAKLLSLLKEFERSGDGFERGVLFLEILMLMKEGGEESCEEKVSIPNKMQMILEYVNEKFPEIDTVRIITERFHVSIPTVNRWFREYLHLSPGELIRAKKLSYAEKLMRSDLSVTEICFRAGFSDCSRFIMLFKKNYGKTPLQYKKALENATV